MKAEKMAAYNKAYYQAHKKQEKERSRVYYQAHKEQRAAYNQAHKEQRAAYSRAYYQEHKNMSKRKVGTRGIYGCVDCFYFGVEYRGRFYCAYDKARLYPMGEEPETGCFMKDECGRYRWFSMWEKPSEARR